MSLHASKPQATRQRLSMCNLWTHGKKQTTLTIKSPDYLPTILLVTKGFQIVYTIFFPIGTGSITIATPSTATETA